MHATNHSEIIGHLDKKTANNNTAQASGWCMAKKNDSLQLRVNSNGVIQNIVNTNRADVAKCYKITGELSCGWAFEASLPCILQAYYNKVWVDVFAFNSSVPDKKISVSNSISSYIVVDNFYENPNDVRDFALGCDFKYHHKYHKGRRTDECYRFDGIKERFEQIIGKKIINWEKYGTNGCFQYCVGGDQLVYHCDEQQYAGVLFLTPDAPVNSGTCLLRSKHTKKMKVSKEEHAKVFANGYLDSTEFEKVDSVGNVYNRVVLFDSKCIHAATEYFGTCKENGRLFQLFFFDLE